MRKTPLLGELEQLVLLAILRLGNRAYGMNIRRELAAASGGDVSIGAVYSALDRMERKGMLTSVLSAPTPERGGRARRCFRVEPTGQAALMQSLQTMTKLLDGVTIDPQGGRA